MRRECYRTLLVAFLLFPTAVLMAAGGKIHGKVTDHESGEALVGATIQVVGTSFGATSDVNGVFTILNLNPGTYVLKASYIGYQTITLANLTVNADLTTEANFALPSEGVKIATVEIIAQRPLVNKSATNSVGIMGSDFFDNVPFRGVAEAVTLQSGVVGRNGNIYIRGSRADETGFQLEGVGINNVLNGGAAVTVTQEAVQETQVQLGGYVAEFGGANGGIVSSSLRSGGENWKVTAQLETDNYTKQGTRSLGGYSYGYSDYVGTVSGPVMSDKIRFFGSVENQFYRDPGAINNGVPTPEFWGGGSFTGTNAIISNDVLSHQHPTTVQADTLNLLYQPGNQIGGGYNAYTYTGTLQFDLGNVKVRGAGSYNSTSSQAEGSINQAFDLSRLPITQSSNGFVNLKLTQFLTSNTFYEVNFNYFNYGTKTMDPFLKENFNAYGDSLANAKEGFYYAGNSSLFGTNALGYWSNLVGTRITMPGTPLSGYSHTAQSSLGGRIDLSSQMKNHALKFGGEFTQYTIRRFALSANGSVQRYNILNDPSLTPLQKDASLRYNGYMDNYGYDPLGNEITGDAKVGQNIVDFGPRQPVFAAAYIQDKIELQDIVLNVGLRFDYINPASKTLTNATNIGYVDSLNVIATSSLKDTDPTKQISPRLGFSFPVTDRTVFHAQYGKFIQQSQLRDSYMGLGEATYITNGGNWITNVVGYGLKPERSTQYELGFSQQVSDNASFDATAFYKDIRDQIQAAYLVPTAGATNRAYLAYVNGDFATTKGVELKFTLRRVERMQAQIGFTLSDARATGSSSGDLTGAAYNAYVAKTISPVTFNQANHGNLSLDYRFAKNDGGPILQQLGMNLLMRFGSGFAFTRVNASGSLADQELDVRSTLPVENVGASTTPWTYELDLRIDKTVSFGSLGANFYIYVQNLLNTKNVITVFARTGDPADDGWLGSTAGINQAQNSINPAQYNQLYNATYLGDNSGNYGVPRQIRFGVNLEY
jgi:outer membrane receptor protein involved in Fe transport